MYVSTQAGRNYLEGTVVAASAAYTSGTTYTVGTIPASIAPLATQTFACSVNLVAVAAVSIDTGGNVTFVPNISFTNSLALSLGSSWRMKGL